jgi:hypothetical protein
MAAKGWSTPFDDPIPLPRGRQFVMLHDAGNYITKLPKAVHEAKEWQAPMEALILVATAGRADDVCADRRHAGVELKHRARLHSQPQRSSLGTAQAGAGSMRKDGNDVRLDAHSGLKSDIAPCPERAKMRHARRYAPNFCTG